MSDLINRQEAIDHLKIRLVETALNNFGTIASSEKIYEDIADNRVETWLRELPPSGDNQGAVWIPTKDRMPDRSDMYLVTWEFMNHRQVILAWYARMDHNSNKCFHYVNDDGDDVSIEGEVVAWMPIISPYKED